MTTQRGELEKRVKALRDAGLDASAEEAALAKLKSQVSPARGMPRAIPIVVDELFLPLNLECFRTGGGGGWQPPSRTGIFPALSAGFLVPDFVADQVWFTFVNREGEETFRGALACGSLHGQPGVGGAWKVKDVLVALGAPYEEDILRGGLLIQHNLQGLPCQVAWDDVVIKGKTERRIQNVYSAGQQIEQAF